MQKNLQLLTSKEEDVLKKKHWHGKVKLATQIEGKKEGSYPQKRNLIPTW